MIGDRDTGFSSAIPHRAVIDVGSNTVRMVVYGGNPRAPNILLNEKVAARLGENIPNNGRMSDKSIAIALAGLRRYRLILTDLHVNAVDVITTAAPRLAENGSEFMEEIRKIGFDPVPFSGEEEARTSAMGVIGAFPGASGVVADLGGGSLELVEIADGKSAHGVSLPLGTLMLPDLRKDGAAKFKRQVNKTLKHHDWAHPTAQPLYMVGGTWRALAVLAMHDAKHPLTDPHGFELSGEEAMKLAKHVRLSGEAKLKIPRISAGRSAMLPDAAALLQNLLNKLEPTRVIFSSWGLREGRIFDQLDPAARAQDPLLAGVAAFAAPRGGPPTLATRMAGWTVDALPQDGAGSERVRLAATMLALASMQIEPNLRLKQAINWALYKRWIDLKADGRGMIAAALAANCGQTDPSKTLGKLASPEQLHEAICWGLAIRFARRLGAGSRRSLNNSALTAENGRLVLYLGETHRDLRAEHVDQDLAQLAAHLGLEPAIVVVPDDSLLARNSLSLQHPAARQIA